MSFLRSGTFLRALAAAAVLAVAAPAPAQFGLTGGIGEAFRPAMTPRDMQLMVDMLGLDEPQQFILETLFEDYDDEFHTGVDGFRDRITQLRDEISPVDPDPAQIMSIVFKALDEWREESRQLSDALMESIKALLNDDQLAKWPQFERRLFRMKYLRAGQLPSEDLDLITEIRAMDLETAQLREIESILSEYELRLDEALRAREAYLGTSQTELIGAVQGNNPEAGLVVADRQLALRKAVRDVNESYTQALAAALPDDVGVAFLERIRQKTYPRVYRRTNAQRVFLQAKELENLDPDVLEAVNALEQAFLVELAVYNERLVVYTREQKTEEIRSKVEGAVARVRGVGMEQKPDQTRQEYQRREEMSTRYVDQLKAVLGPELFAMLPGARRYSNQETMTPDQQRDVMRSLRSVQERRAESGIPASAVGGRTVRETDTTEDGKTAKKASEP